MYLFNNDYSQGCHDEILNRLVQLQSRQFPGYGVDDCCRNAAEYIKKLCGNDALSVHFLVGGTQTNLTVIAASLRPHQGVLAADSAHINVHETGSIEAIGHKIIALPSTDGKITAAQIRAYMIRQNSDDTAEHMVQAKMVYISNSTELGTIYYKEELRAISETCKEYGLYLFVDGARLGYALTACDNDLTMEDLAELCDVFYIGGTKVGALFGEAVVIKNLSIACDFRYIIKQHGGMLAKGWLLGVQFETLLEDGLYFEIAKQANSFADCIRDTLKELGYPLFVNGTTNQIFAILPNYVLSQIGTDFTFQRQETIDEGHTVVRFCTSWATTQMSVDALCHALRTASSEEAR